MKVGVALAVLFYFFKTVTPIGSYMTTNYSRWEEHHQIAKDAHTVGCSEVSILVSPTTRTSYATLKSMDLVINTTTWWGDHPVMAYYANIPTSYFYAVSEFEKTMILGNTTRCFIMETGDWNENWGLRVLSKNAKYYLGVSP